ncbi:MAG: hypothetical protein IJM28_04400, partial [Lachnospiraceae bacterium]|nr:hypothetical protein [Lachnospiraceae bacterium]
RQEFYREIGSQKSVVMITLLNIFETCVYRGALDVADYYKQETIKLITDETDLYKRTIHLFLSGMLDYKEGKKEKGIEEMNKAIKIFEWVGSENLANNYKKDFEKYVK